MSGPGRTRRVAGIDCGTNSIRLLIADTDPVTGAHQDVVRRMEIVRLGQGVDKTGELAPEALARTLAMTAEFAGQCRQAGVEAIRFVATSATRDAANAAEFAAGVRAAIGVDPEVVSGEEEARLSFLGARGAASALPGPYLVVDSGGGSTEFALGEDEPAQLVSVDTGCVRITERHLADDPPTAAQVADAAADADAAVARAAAAVDFSQAATLVGLAGCITTLTALALRLPSYQPERIHGAEHTPAQMLAVCDEMIAMPRDQRLALGFMHPGRADVIAGGAIVWSRVIRAVLEARRAAGKGEVRFVTSEQDILDGIAVTAARSR